MGQGYYKACCSINIIQLSAMHEMYINGFTFNFHINFDFKQSDGVDDIY